MSVRHFLLSMLLAAPLAALATPMTNDDVIKMVKGGLSEAIVIQAIDGAEPGFDTSPDGLVKLKQGGVSDAVIQRILVRRGAPDPATQPACPQCGTVVLVREIDKPGQASGVGAVAGGAIGGVLGRQIGGRDHRTAGTVVGAVGGAVAGHHIEKHARSGKTWEINVALRRRQLARLPHGLASVAEHERPRARGERGPDPDLVLRYVTHADSASRCACATTA